MRGMLIVCLNVGLAIMAWTASAATAQIQMPCNSIRMFPGDCSCGFGLIWTMSFSTFYTEDPPQANGELAPVPGPASYTHWSYLVLEDPSLVASATYAEMSVPSDDADGNGTPDFHEIGRAVSTTSNGKYVVAWNPGYGDLILNWSRNAGSRSGSCQLYMDDPILGMMGPFNHTFELIEHSGTLAYSAGSNVVTGTIHLHKNGQTTDWLEGPVTLAKVLTNRFNLLTLMAGEWTNQTDVFTFNECQLKRDAIRPTVYQGSLQNPYGNYRAWRLSIVDTNDANRNGIPDLSDDVAVAPPRRPTLALALTTSQLVLRVSGDAGRLHLVQEAATPNAITWKTAQSLTLTNDPQILTLPLPSESPTFWRVLAP